MNADARLSRIRYLLRGNLTQNGYIELFDAFRELDAHLSAGGTPPEAWREGPDAPAEEYSHLGWQGDPRADEEDRDERPAPEGLEAFAHWSGVHNGINVEITVPDDDMPLTIHVNDGIVFHRGEWEGTI